VVGHLDFLGRVHYRAKRGCWNPLGDDDGALRNTGLLDEMQIHLVAVVLVDGVRLFDHLGAKQIKLEKTRPIEPPSATHLRLTIPK
jgi:hypothetical protein